MPRRASPRSWATASAMPSSAARSRPRRTNTPWRSGWSSSRGSDALRVPHSIISAQVVLPRRLHALVAEPVEEGAHLGVLVGDDLGEEGGHGVDLHPFPGEAGKLLGQGAQAAGGELVAATPEALDGHGRR